MNLARNFNPKQQWYLSKTLFSVFSVLFLQTSSILWQWLSLFLKRLLFFFYQNIVLYLQWIEQTQVEKNKQNPIYTPYRFDRVRLLNHPKRPCSSAARRFTLYPVVFVVNESWCSGKRIKTDEPNRVWNTRIWFVESRARSFTINSIWRDAVETNGRRYIG